MYYAGRCLIDGGKQFTVHGVDESEKKKNFAIEAWMKELEDMGAFVYSLFDCCRVHDQTGWDFLIQNNLRLEKQRIMLTGWSKD